MHLDLQLIYKFYFPAIELIRWLNCLINQSKLLHCKSQIIVLHTLNQLSLDVAR